MSAPKISLISVFCRTTGRVSQQSESKEPHLEPDLHRGTEAIFITSSYIHNSLQLLCPKSLGDLTSDDIWCNFDSKYHSIICSFTVRQTKDQFPNGSPQNSASHFTEHLRKLTDVEPLTAGDFASRV